MALFSFFWGAGASLAATQASRTGSVWRKLWVLGGKRGWKECFKEDFLVT